MPLHVVQVHRLFIAGNEQLELVGIEEVEPTSRHNLVDALEEGRRLRMNARVEPEVGHEVNVLDAVVLCDGNIAAVGHEITDAMAQALIQSDAHVERKLVKVAVISFDKQKIAVHLGVQGGEVVEKCALG